MSAETETAGERCRHGQRLPAVHDTIM